jgi:hypothetical protein
LVPQPSEEDLDMERDMEYAFDADDLVMRPPAADVE